MIDFLQISKEELNTIEEMRAKRLEESTNGFIMERRSPNPIINDLRFNHGYWHIHQFLINNDGLKFEVWTEEKRKRLHIAFISVPEELRQQGHGSKMMKTICELADKYGYTLDLDVDARFGVGKRVLLKFYKSFGFVREKGSDHMKRVNI